MFGVILTDHWNVKGETLPQGVHSCDAVGMRNFWSQGESKGPVMSQLSVTLGYY